MSDIKKSKSELILESQLIADEYFDKKKLIESALDNLDSKEKITQEHFSGMSIIEEMFRELDVLEEKQKYIFEEIKKL